MKHDSPTSTASELSPDSPPSYDYVTSLPIDGSSQPETRSAPKALTHLFSSPPNAEALLGPPTASTGIVDGITLHRRPKYSHTCDPRLGDPAVLYDFCRSQTLNVPPLKFHCLGVHWETPTRDEVVLMPNGTTKHRKKGQYERVVDFDFTIDLASLLDHPDNKANIHLSTVHPETPTYRGSHSPRYAASYAPRLVQNHPYQAMQSDVDWSLTEVGRTATPSEKAIRDEYEKWRRGKGLPRWSIMKDCQEFWETRGKGKTVDRPGSGPGTGALALSDDPAGIVERNESGEDSLVRQQRNAPGLKQWCEKYCSDRGLLKEFRLQKQIWGWDLAGLEAAIRGAILSTGYVSNHLEVSFNLDDQILVVHPSNLLSQAIYNPFVYVLLWITMLYPVIWIWQHIHISGGAPYDIARATYAVKYYPPLPSTFNSETLPQAEERLPGMFKVHPELPHPTHLQPGPKGVHYLLGRKEGEWFREWEERIRTAVRLRYQGVLAGGGTGANTGEALDGYSQT